MSDIEVITLDGGKKTVSKDRLILRPAAYAIIVNDDQLLLVKMHQNGKYHLPGGGIEIGERIHETLIRETREETGIEINVDRFAHFEEMFFFLRPFRESLSRVAFLLSLQPQNAKFKI